MRFETSSIDKIGRGGGLKTERPKKKTPRIAPAEPGVEPGTNQDPIEPVQPVAPTGERRPEPDYEEPKEPGEDDPIKTPYDSRGRRRLATRTGKHIKIIV